MFYAPWKKKMETSKEYSASCVIKDASSDQLSVPTPADFVEGEQTTGAMNALSNIFMETKREIKNR